MRALPLVLVFAVACGGASSGGNGNGNGDAGDNGGDGGNGGNGGNIDADLSGCEAPDMLILLDRTMSMHRQPDGAPAEDTPEGLPLSKWWQAVDAIESFTAAVSGVRFGLALFPRDPGEDLCVTLQERIAGTRAGNVNCEAGEIAVPPGVGTADAIADAIDHTTTRLCRSTPIGAGFVTAQTELVRVQDPIRDQYVVLLTDGQDTCDEPLVLSTVHDLAQNGVRVYAIGFDATDGNGVDNELLNNIACAGQTAPDFPTPCTNDGSGNYLATTPDGDALYLLAENASELTASLEQVGGEVCCGCIE